MFTNGNLLFLSLVINPELSSEKKPANDDFWRQKLLAFLHDPPHKPFRIVGHEDTRETYLHFVGLSLDEMRTEFARIDDHWAAAADRLIFPKGVRSDWEKNRGTISHPLSGNQFEPDTLPPSPEGAEEWLTQALQKTQSDSDADWKTKYLRAWRLWPEYAARSHPSAHLAYLVADTRIPDHTLWHHNGLVSAFTGCNKQVAMLLFQIGPVQDFIKQSRTMRDLWAGSYLLSYLIAQALLAIADEVGPESIIFPNLRGVSLADYHWWKKGLLHSDEKLRASHGNELTTPCLPNRFLALVPAERAEELAACAEMALRDAWHQISCTVHDAIENKVGKDHPGWDASWHDQISRFPTVDFAIHIWPESAQTTYEQAAKNHPPLKPEWEKHPAFHARLWAEQMIPNEDKDARCYKAKSWQESGHWFSQLLNAEGKPLADGEMGLVTNPGQAWALHYAAADWKFAGVKNARIFEPWTGHPKPKDHLNGRDEILGDEVFWADLRKEFPYKFKGNQLYGAMTVIKRLYPGLWMEESLDCNQPTFDSVQDIAEAIDSESESATKTKYYAVLCMDGDDMGQWVSGAKAPAMLDLLSPEAREDFIKRWQPNGAGGLAASDVQRPLTPGYHAALSEALSNFSLYCARAIVSGFDGELIYSGGDDVLAILPAVKALDCAQALQLVFRGMDPQSPEAHASDKVKEVLRRLFDFPAPGFVRCKTNAGAQVHLKPNWPLLVMGPRATASVGIAIGHVRSPMQDIIQAARDAEHTAKQVPGKGAFCLSILKRSGESVSISGKWDSGTPGVWQELEADVHNLTGRFAYMYSQRMDALLRIPGHDTYVSQWDEMLRAAAKAELTAVFKRQTTGKQMENQARELAASIVDRLAGLSPREFLHFWMAWAFVERIKNTDEGVA